MTMGMRVAGLTWCTLAALAVPPLAHAQSVTQAPAAETVGERAAPFFQEGLKAADEARWADAEAAYLKAWAIAKTFDIAANLGVVELKLGKPRLAATHLAFSLRTAPPSAKAPHLERTRQLIEEAKKQVGVLRVRVNVAQARVLIDGEPLLIEETPDAIFVEPGTHRVTGQRDGYIDSEKVVTVEAGTSQEVTLLLAELPSAAAPAPQPAWEARAVEVPPEMRRSWVPVIALGAASAVGLGVAVGFTVASNDASADAHAYSAALARANEQCIKPHGEFAATCEQTSNAASRAGTLGDVAFASYVISGGLALAAAAYTVWPVRKKTPDAGVRLAPFGGMGAAGILAAGAW